VSDLKVLIVESSGAVSSRVLGALDGPMTPAGTPVPPADMAEQVRERSPALVLLEVDDQGPDLSRAVEQVMHETPTPVLLMIRDDGDRQAAIGLLAAGALDVMWLPEEPDAAFFQSLKRQLKLLAGVKVVKHPRGRKRKSSQKLPSTKPGFPVVAVAASLGGPKALAVLLAGLPRPFAAPLLVCQHITPGFSDDLALWLQAETGQRVVEAVDGQPLLPGEVLVAPAHVHLAVTPDGKVKLEDTAAVGGFKPSCDVMLTSVAQAFGPRAIGVVLTGMGRDGAKGLFDVRKKGGHTVAQDEKSCVVFGMPREAIALGGAEKVLPLPDIAAQLSRWVS